MERSLSKDHFPAEQDSRNVPDDSTSVDRVGGTLLAPAFHNVWTSSHDHMQVIAERRKGQHIKAKDPGQPFQRRANPFVAMRDMRSKDPSIPNV
jgi:hypothetical protein